MKMLEGTNPQGDFVVYFDEETLLNQNYWDCDCSYDYIRPIIEHHCKECGSDREDSLISHEVEVQQLVYKHIFE